MRAVITFVVGLVIGVAAGVAVTGWLTGGGPDVSGPVESQEQEDYPKLDSRLFQLAVTEDPRAFARRTQLDLEEGRVRVVVEFDKPERLEVLRWTIEALGGQVELAVEGRLQVLVPVGTLRTLARHPDVAYIRPPVKPRPG